ncbi:MAG: hypothetical protein IKU46_08200, partial [Peptococcaceae bacterium]|nr:hypothetical protein [Peptococcaceae bacterium]
RQTGDLLASSFRFHLSMDTLEVHYYLPAAGRFRDFHPLDYSHAERTTERASRSNIGWLLFYSDYPAGVAAPASLLTTRVCGCNEIYHLG